MPTTVHFTDPSGRTHPAILALPAGPPRGGVIVIHDLTGHREDTTRHCARFAEAGYAALAPNLFSGFGCLVRTVSSMASGLGAAFEVIEAARTALIAHSGVPADRVAITGFCMGGGFALLAAANGRYAVAAPFYGVVPRSRRRLQGLCPTIAQFGERDLFLAGHPERLEAHLQALGVPHEVLVYEGVGHSFMNDHKEPWMKLGAYTPLRAAYDAGVEAKAWAALLAFLERHMLA
jgi:carboxymethylenebutenolidase